MAWGVQGSVVLTMVIFQGVLGSTRGVRQYLRPNLVIFQDGVESKGKFCPYFVYIQDGLGSTGKVWS